MIRFAKGHGTENDFVVLPDPDGTLELTPARVAALCDRRRGLGADGVLRVVRWAALKDDAFPAAPGVEWFMDYRNADGGLAEMCGNGVRVYARWLADAGWLPEGPAAPLRLGTRAGVREVRFAGDATWPSTWARRRSAPRRPPTVGGRAFAGIAVDVGNPHLACVTDDRAGRARPHRAARLRRRAVPARGERRVRVAAAATGEVAMRVHERGVGETRSCGTGTVAAVVAALRAAGATTGDVAVRTPGGRLRVVVADGDDGAAGARGARRVRRAGSALVGRRSDRVTEGSDRDRNRRDAAHVPVGVCRPTMTELPSPDRPVPDPPVDRRAASSRTAARCAASPACPPSSPTSPRSSTASCAWSASSSSACGPRAAPSRPRPR